MALGCGDDGSAPDDGGPGDAQAPADLAPRLDLGPPPPPAAEPGRPDVEVISTRQAYLLDLPSRRDTCFAATLPPDDLQTIVVYDTSSDIDGEDIGESEGQRGPTLVYRHVLRFSPRGE